MENRPGALELTHTEGPERPPSRQRGGVEEGQYKQMLANPGCTREPAGSFEKYNPSPNADALADSVALGWDLGIRISKRPHIIRMYRQGRKSNDVQREVSITA